MKSIAIQQSNKQNEQQIKKMYIKIAEELIGSVKQKKLQIEDLLNKQHLKMCHMQFNEENAKESLNKLGKVYRLMKIVCKIIIESNPKREKKILINPETSKLRQVKKSEYTEESEQNDSIQENQNKDFQQFLKNKELVHQKYAKEGLQKILSKVSSIYDINENEKEKNKLRIKQIADAESIKKLEKALNNQKRVNIKRYKSMIKICIKSLCMVMSLFKRLQIDSESESEEICSIAKLFNQKYHQGERNLSSQELKSINGRMEKIYTNLQQKYINRNNIRS